MGALQRLIQLTLPTSLSYYVFQDTNFCEEELKSYIATPMRALQKVSAQYLIVIGVIDRIPGIF